MHLKNPLDNEFLTAKDVIMVPRQGVVPSRQDPYVTLEPYIYSAPMDCVTGHEMARIMLEQSEIPVISRFLPEKEQTQCLRDFCGTDAFFAISTKPKAIDAFFAVLADLIENDEGVAEVFREGRKINLAIDVAHGDSVSAHATATMLQGQVAIGLIMSGSICTPDGAQRAVKAGCTHIRVGVGPGAACTTRRKTGCGFPQLSAVYLIYKSLQAEHPQIKIIADGGIKEPGEANIYLAAGATGIMMGSVLSKAKESPGWTEKPVCSQEEWIAHLQSSGAPLSFPLPNIPTAMSKTYRGQASAAFQTDQFGEPNRCPEGSSSDSFEYDGVTTVETILEEYRGGLRSAISYLGHSHIEDLTPEQVTFVRLTAAGFTEGTAHGV